MTMAGQNPVGMLLKAARDAKGLTQEDMGDILGMTSNGYGKIERGKNGVPSDRLYAMCRKLEISPMKLLRAIAGDPEPDDVLDRFHVRFPGSGCPVVLPEFPTDGMSLELAARDNGYAVLYTSDDWDIHVMIAEYAGVDPRSAEAVELSKPVIDAHARAECRKRLATERENENESEDV